MRKLWLTLCAMSVLAISAAAQDVTAPIQQMMKAFNADDDKALAALYASGDVLILDEVPPYRWSGPNANSAWLADLEKHDKAHGVSNETVTAGAPLRTDIDGDTAYVLVPTTYTWKEKGKPMAESATMTFVMHKEGGAWKISAWTWNGRKPHAAK